MEVASLLHSQRACLQRHSADGLATSGKPVELTVTLLSQDLAARLLAAECHRLKSEFRVRCDEYRILQNLCDAEGRLHDAAKSVRLNGGTPYGLTARYRELVDSSRLCHEKQWGAASQLLELGEEKGVLSQASFSVLGTMNALERMAITEALEPQDFKDGAVLIKEGEPRDAYFIIVQGQVSCTQRRDHRCVVGPACAPPFWSASARGRPGTRAPQHVGAPVLCPARPRHRGARPRAPPKAPERHQARRRLAASSAATRALLRRPSRALTPQARPGRDRGQARLPADQPAVRVYRDRGR